MLDQNAFMETLHAVAEIMRTSEKTMSREEILSYFKDMELSEEQKNMVFEYLLTSDEEDGEANVEPDYEEVSDETETGNVNKEHSGVFRMYLEEIENMEKPSEEKMNELYEKFMGGDSGLVNEILNGWLPKVIKIAEKNSHPKVLMEDIVQEGNMGLYVELTRIADIVSTGPDKIIMDDIEDLLTDAVTDAVKSYVSMMTGEEDSQNTVVGKVNLVKEAQKYLENQNGAVPGIEELSEFTKMSVQELRDVLDIMAKAEKR